MRTLIFVHQGERQTTFALIENGIYRFVQYRNEHVQVEGVRWSVLPGAASACTHSSARRAHAHETVNVDGAELSEGLLDRLRAIPEKSAA